MSGSFADMTYGTVWSTKGGREKPPEDLLEAFRMSTE